MGERKVHDDLPEQDDIEEAILRHVKAIGKCTFRELPKPIADKFDLSYEQRNRTTKSGEKVWYHCCNTACQSLVEDERLERINGIYGLKKPSLIRNAPSRHDPPASSKHATEKQSDEFFHYVRRLEDRMNRLDKYFNEIVSAMGKHISGVRSEMANVRSEISKLNQDRPRHVTRHGASYGNRDYGG